MEGCNHAMISFVIIAKLVYVKFGPSQTDVASDHIFYRSSRRGLLSKTKSTQKKLCGSSIVEPSQEQEQQRSKVKKLSEIDVTSM